MSNKTSGSFSWRTLWAVFGMGLFLFVAIRWDATPWLRQKIDAAMVHEHLDVSYRSLEYHGLHITLHEVQFNDPRMPQTLLLHDVDISLDVLALLRGDIAANVHMENDFMDMQSWLRFNYSRLDLKDLDVSLNVEGMQTWLALPLPAHAEGMFHLDGSLTIDIDSGIPQSADLTAHWQHAGGSMMSQHYSLGDYTLKAHIIEQNIQWNMTGGKGLSVAGEGSIQMATTPLPQWKLQGNLKVQAEKSSPLATFLTDSERHLQLSGNIEHPQWQW
ncbi:MAG: type II secretion system protein N [Mariprofundaceae bacterium]|nr:type II secretion system protein N [Mariprofundaceae bacterium]